MDTTPTIDYFSAYAVELYPDVRFYNTAEEEFMKLMGVRHAEDGQLYAILADPDPEKEESGATYEEPVGVFPFTDVEYGPAAVTVSLMAPFAEMVQATRPYTDGEMDGLL